jgi:hypothetical protein
VLRSKEIGIEFQLDGFEEDLPNSLIERDIMKKNEPKIWTLAKLARKQLNEDIAAGKVSILPTKEVVCNEPNFRGSSLKPMPYVKKLAHQRTFKENALIGQFKAKLIRKEIKTEDVPPTIMNAIIADTVAQGQAALNQANKLESEFDDGQEDITTKSTEHTHDEHCQHD